jgi:hypothetical protein
MTPDQVHSIIKNKYEKLIWTIAHKISGDVATSSLEDNYQDLWMAAFEAVEGFTKQNNYSNGPVETWIDTKSFDKYIKTCLWNKKNHKGKQISNKYEIQRDTVSTHLEEVLNVCSPDSTLASTVFSDVEVILSQREKEVVSCVLSDPDRYLTDGGKVKILPIQKNLGCDRKGVVDAMEGIKKKMKRGCTGSI